MRIFITRHLAPGSPFRQSLTQAGHEVLGESLLQFQGVPAGRIPVTDFIFFYSKNAVRFFLGQWQPPENAPRMACIGHGTAQALEQAGHLPYFTGSGQPREVARQFLPHCQGKSVLFPRARQSRMSIQEALRHEDITLHDVVVYDNTMRTGFPHPQADILVFTSPMNARAYFLCHAHQGETIISIGSSTTAALEELGIPRIHQSPTPSEASLAATALGI